MYCFMRRYKMIFILEVRNLIKKIKIHVIKLIYIYL